MEKRNELRIRGVNPTVKTELKNISDNLGIDMGALIKPKLAELRDSYAEHMRKPKPKD